MTSDSQSEIGGVVSSTAWFDSVFDVLKNIGGAHESMRQDFVYHHARSADPCDEYRFKGKLGFGGKYWRKENRVSCYREDETPERLRVIIELDAALANLSNTEIRQAGPETHEPNPQRNPALPASNG